MVGKLTAKKVIAALKEEGGLITPTARRLGCTRQTIYNWRDNDASVREFMEEERALLVDEAEGAIRKLIKEDNFNAAQLVLRTLGKGRGWTEKPEGLDLVFDIQEMNEVMSLLIASGVSVDEFMQRARALAENRLAQMGKAIPARVEPTHDDD